MLNIIVAYNRINREEAAYTLARRLSKTLNVEMPTVSYGDTEEVILDRQGYPGQSATWENVLAMFSSPIAA